jgi:hypothetical protein
MRVDCGLFIVLPELIPSYAFAMLEEMGYK